MKTCSVITSYRNLLRSSPFAKFTAKVSLIGIVLPRQARKNSFRSMMGVEDEKHIRGEGKVMKPENIGSASNNFLIVDNRVKLGSKVPKTIKGDGKLGGRGPGLEKVEEEATMKA